MDKLLIAGYCVGAGLLLYGCSKLRIGTLESFPYRNTVYVEPSSLNLCLQPDSKSGVCFGRYYVAGYMNPGSIDSDTSTGKQEKATVYYLATKDTVNGFVYEFYYNRPNTH